MNILAFLSMLISLCMSVDAAWQPYSKTIYSAEKQDITPYVQVISQAYYNAGAFAPGGKPHDIAFSYRIAPSSRILGMTMVQNYSPGISQGYCMRVVALNGPIRYPNNTFYGSPIWYPTLTHEIGHVYQGAGCSNASYAVESGAEIAMFIIMADLAKTDEVAKAGLIYELRRELILATMDMLNRSELEITPKDLLDKLQLTEKERRYFDYFVNYPAALRAAGSLYWTAAITRILNNDGDIFCRLSFGGSIEAGKPQICFDGSALMDFIEGLKDKR